MPMVCLHKASSRTPGCRVNTGTSVRPHGRREHAVRCRWKLCGFVLKRRLNAAKATPTCTSMGGGKRRRRQDVLIQLGRNTATPRLTRRQLSSPRRPGSVLGGDPATREPRSAQGGPGRGGRRAASDQGGFIVSFRPPPPPALGRGVTGKASKPPGGGLFIERAARASRSPARLTGPLTRLAAGPSPRGCAPGAGHNGLLCVQLPPPEAGGGDRPAAPGAPSLAAGIPERERAAWPPPRITGTPFPWPGPGPRGL